MAHTVSVGLRISAAWRRLKIARDQDDLSDVVALEDLIDRLLDEYRTQKTSSP